MGLPDVSLPVGWCRSGNHDLALVGRIASVGWELDVWGKLRAQRAASEAGYQATALDYACERQSLAATVAKTWYMAIEAQQLVKLAEQSVAIFSEQLKLVTIRQNTGKGTDLDVVDTRATVESAKNAVELAREAYSTIRRALELLLGRYPAAEINIATAQQAQAYSNYGSVILKAFGEVETAIFNEQSLARRLPFNESAVRDRIEAVRIAKEQYVAGRKDLLWVTYLKDNQITTEAALIKLRAATHLNHITLLLALGSSFEDTPAVTISQFTN